MKLPIFDDTPIIDQIRQLANIIPNCEHLILLVGSNTPDRLNSA